MLHRLLPAWLHIAALRIAHPVRLRWWRLTGVTVRGCRVLVQDPAGRVLLIRHSYGSGNWMLPGGGVDRGETPLAAAMREVREETACRLDRVLAIGMVDHRPQERNHEVHLVAGWTDDAPQADGREIVEAAFFALDALPDRLSSPLASLLPDYVTRATVARPADQALPLHP